MNRASQSAQRSECFDPARQPDNAQNNRQQNDADLAATMGGLSIARRDKNLPPNLSLEPHAPMSTPRKDRNTRTTWSITSSPMQRSTRGNTSSYCSAQPNKDGPQVATLTKGGSRRTKSREASAEVRRVKMGKKRPRDKVGGSSTDENQSRDSSPEPRRTTTWGQASPCILRLLCYLIEVPGRGIFQYSLFLDRGGPGNIISQLNGSVGSWQYNEQENVFPPAAGLFKNIFVAQIRPSLISTYLLFVRGQNLSDPPNMTSKDWCLKVLERLNEHDVADFDFEDIRRRSQPSTVHTGDTGFSYL